MISRANWTDLSNIDGNAINRLLPPLVSLVLVVIVGWQVAKLVWLLIPTEPGSPTHSAIDSLPRATTTPVAATDVSAIADSHIFGIADAEEDGPVLPPTEHEVLPETRISLILNGTVASEIPNYSVAIISDRGNDQTVYTIGDSVGNNATLHAVYADRVVLNENGTLTSLLLPREFKDAPARSVRQATATPRSPGGNSRSSIQSVVTQNLTKLTDVIRPTPYRVQGQQVGFRVYPGRDRRAFAALGLRPGDIIKDIDGQALSDASRAMQIFQSLGTAEQVTVTIERDGKSESLTLKTSQLDLSSDRTK